MGAQPPGGGQAKPAGAKPSGLDFDANPADPEPRESLSDINGSTSSAIDSERSSSQEFDTATMANLLEIARDACSTMLAGYLNKHPDQTLTVDEGVPELVTEAIGLTGVRLGDEMCALARYRGNKQVTLKHLRAVWDVKGLMELKKDDNGEIMSVKKRVRYEETDLWRRYSRALVPTLRKFLDRAWTKNFQRLEDGSPAVEPKVIFSLASLLTRTGVILGDSMARLAKFNNKKTINLKEFRHITRHWKKRRLEVPSNPPTTPPSEQSKGDDS